MLCVCAPLQHLVVASIVRYVCVVPRLLYIVTVLFVRFVVVLCSCRVQFRAPMSIAVVPAPSDESAASSSDQRLAPQLHEPRSSREVSIPDDVVYYFLDMVDFLSLVCARRVNKQWHKITFDISFRLARFAFGIDRRLLKRGKTARETANWNEAYATAREGQRRIAFARAEYDEADRVFQKNLTAFVKIVRKITEPSASERVEKKLKTLRRQLE